METYASATVFENGHAALRYQIEKLNKRAARHGMRPLELRTKELAYLPVYKDWRFGHQRSIYHVEIMGVAPRIDGWRLLARVEFTSIGNVVHIAPGVDDNGDFAEYRKVGSVCEHCNTYRKRNDIFVLEHENGSRKLVGRNCLADFLRCKDAADFARLAEYADCALEACNAAEGGDEDYFGGGWGVRNMRLENYLPVVAMLMRRVGWTSRTQAKDDNVGSATADQAYSYLFSNDSYTKAWIEKNELYASDDDRALADRAVEWARMVDASGSEYLYTISRIAETGFVDFKGLDGYAASIVIAYKKAYEQFEKRAKQNKDKGYYGEAKKRYKGVPVVCKGTHCFEGYYGVTTIVRFEHTDENGNCAVLVWFASGDKEYDWESGEEYTIDFTVKDFDDHEKFGKQTKINRVK